MPAPQPFSFAAPFCLPRRALPPGKMLASALVPALLAAGGASAQSWDSRERLLGPGSATAATQNGGLALDLSLLQFGQSAVSGSGENEFEDGGKARAIVTMDGEKIGLWPGFSVLIDYEYVYGNFPGRLGSGNGTLIPVNAALSLPVLDGDDDALSISFTQAFNDSVALSLGTFNAGTLASQTPILGGGGTTGFMNMGVAAPINGVIPPYLAGGILSVTTPSALWTAMVYDPRNADDSDVIDDLFGDGVTMGVLATLPTAAASGLPAFHTLGAFYSTRDTIDLASLPQLALPPELRGPIGTAEDYWYLSYAYQQMLVSLGGDKGWGVFFEAGISDGNPNPLRGHVFAGLAGDSPLNGRDNDSWGVSAFHYELSSDLKTSADTLGLPIGNETGLEAYYTYALAPWALITADLQVVNPATETADTAVYAGLRAEIRF